MSPFHVNADTDTGESNEVGYINCKQFFTGYNMTQVETMGHGLVSNGTGGYNFTNQTVNTPSMWYNVMIMPTGLSFNRYSAYSNTNRTRATKTGSYIVFLSSTNFTASNTNIYTESGYTSKIERITNDRLTISTPLGFYLICFKITAVNQHSRGYNWVTIDFPGTTSTQIIPLYMGMQETMPEEIHRLVFGTSNQYITYDWAVKNAVNQVYTAINTQGNALSNAIQQLQFNNDLLNQQILDANQNSASYLYDIRTDTGRILNLMVNDNSSNNKATENNNQNQEIKDAVTDLKTTENAIIGDMNTQFEDINTSPSLINDNGLLNSMRWVRTQYNKMTDDNIIGSLIQYSLLIGLALMLIGRMK